MVRLLLAFLTAVVMLLPAGAGAAEPQPVGWVDGTFGRFDRDDLRPVGSALELGEYHAGPVVSPDGRSLAVGLSSPGSPAAVGHGRVGLWIVDAATMTIAREVRTGIAAEAVVYPGVVAALLQDGALVVVDPVSGRIRSRREVGCSMCGAAAVQAAGRGVFVNEIRAHSVEVATVDATGRVRTSVIRLDASLTDCFRVALATDGRRVYIAGRDRVAVLDPATGRTVSHPLADTGRRRSAAVSAGGLVVAGEHGLRLYDTRTWRVRWRAGAAHSVVAAGSTVVATSDEVRAIDARTGRVRWRAPASPGRGTTVAAGRVYALPAVLDLKTGVRVGAHPLPPSDVVLF